MNSFLRLKVRSVAKVVLVFGVFYLLLIRKLIRRADFNLVIHDGKPENVWNVLADFSNYADLNPELISFHIVDEVHDRSQVSQKKPWLMYWNYTVSYSEYYENLPAFMTNSAIGKYSVYTNLTSYVIESSHSTCILPGWCLVTKAIDDFRSGTDKIPKEKAPNCRLHEIIEFECPLLLLPLCHSEVKLQRTKVLENLANWQF